MDALTIYTPGHWDMYDSYGLIACELACHLSALGVRVSAMGHGETVRDNQPDDVRAITAQPIVPTYGGILLGYPTGYAKHGYMASRGPRIAVTMFESTGLPPGWVEPLNDCDAVVVPSRWLVDVFRAHGVTAPIHVIPLGLGESYQPAVRSADREPFTFLTFSDRGRRKGGVWAEQAFVQAFDDDPRVRLLVKRRAHDIGIECRNTNIDIVQRDMTERELYELYLSCDAMVNPNMGEGFGLIPREFAATGGITLATNWSGTADDIGIWGIPLPYELVEADWRGNRHLEPIAPLGVWAQPDIERTAQMMRDVFEHRDYYQRRAEAVAPRVRRMYSWRRFAERVLDIWRGVANDNREPAHAAAV